MPTPPTRSKADTATAHARDLPLSPPSKAPLWASKWLVAAGIYNLAWGALVVLFPGLLFSATGMEQPLYPQIWQCVGMIVGVYGVGYLAAALDPRRHWPIVLVGLMGKVFGPIGFGFGVLRGELPLGFGATILTNDLIWWIPFSMMLWDAARHNTHPRVRLAGQSAGGIWTQAGPATEPTLDHVLDEARSDSGVSLRELSDDRPLLVALLRHRGCCFCSEALADLRATQHEIAAAGYGLAIVTMSSPEENRSTAAAFGLNEAAWFSDPSQRIYHAAGIERGGIKSLFGPRVWWRGAMAIMRGHRIGPMRGDGFQMPGTIVLHRGAIVRKHPHADASERIDACAMLGQFASAEQTGGQAVPGAA